MPERRSAILSGAGAEALAALLLEHGGCAVCIYDAEDRIVFWNERYLEFFPEARPIIRPGLPFVETLKAFFAIQHPGAHPDSLADAIQRGMERHWTERGPLQYQRGDSSRWLELRMFPRPEGGRVKLWSDVTFDRAPKSLGDDVLSLLTIANVGIMLHGADGALLYCNTRYFSEKFMAVTARIPAIQSRHARGRFWAGFAEVFDDSPAFTAMLDDPRSGPLPHPVVLHGRNGRWFRIEEQAWQGDGIASVWVDVTELKHQELALEASHAALAELNAQLKLMADHDGLTDLPNRRAFNTELARVQGRVRQGLPACVAIMDLDRFKALNDRHGHPSGDLVLIELARRLRVLLGPGDFAARLGGEEFALLLPGTGLEQAEARLEPFRAALAERPFALGSETVQVTASFGVAALTAGRDASRSLSLADKALYMSKHLGRNRISVDDTPVD